MFDHLAAILEYPVIIPNVPKGLQNWTREEKVEIYYLVGKGLNTNRLNLKIHFVEITASLGAILVLL